MHRTLVCEVCTGTKDVIDFRIGDQDHVLCINCRLAILGGGTRNTGAGQVGRPTIGITKKVSLSLPSDLWEWFDERAQGNRSELLRKCIYQVRNQEGNDWSNDACLGYAIMGTRRLGYSEEQVFQIVQAIYGMIDESTVEEAKTIYKCLTAGKPYDQHEG